jgi:hypothetical protein
MYWGIVFGLQIFTFGLFDYVWFVVQAKWVRKVNGKSDAYLWAIFNLLMPPAFLLLIFIEALVGVPTSHPIYAVDLICGTS